LKRSLLYQLGQRGADHLDRLIEEVLLAEELGLESVWCLPEAGASGDFRLGAPEFWIAALAGRTERIRLGWGLAGLTPPDRPPIRSAEQSASLDLACHGRLEIGLLPNWAPEADPVGSEVDGVSTVSGGTPSATGVFPPWDEGIRMLVDMWDGPRFSWTSAQFEVPPVDVVPKPEQKPHPPLWLVGWSLDHARRAGEAGLGFLDVSGGTDDALEIHRDAYLSARSGADPNDLVCVSVYAAALGGGSASQMLDRLEKWSSLDFDQAVLSVDPAEEESMMTRGRIRLLAGESVDLH
jgi:alkanesulfonate monooxygenase SsuD/methylene tetrahydromethanopterin reductase-like flavin-dependent oxidoreductase (luciferase family)